MRRAIRQPTEALIWGQIAELPASARGVSRVATQGTMPPRDCLAASPGHPGLIRGARPGPSMARGSGGATPPPLGDAIQGLVDPNPLNPLQFRFCPPSMAGSVPSGTTKKNYRNPSKRKPTMYAVLVTGGKQYRVMQGETLRVEKLEAEAGNELTFDNILMLGDGETISLGDALKGATVAGKSMPCARPQAATVPL